MQFSSYPAPAPPRLLVPALPRLLVSRASAPLHVSAPPRSSSNVARSLPDRLPVYLLCARIHKLAVRNPATNTCTHTHTHTHTYTCNKKSATKQAQQKQAQQNKHNKTSATTQAQQNKRNKSRRGRTGNTRRCTRCCGSLSCTLVTMCSVVVPAGVTNECCAAERFQPLRACFQLHYFLRLSNQFIASIC